MTSYQKIDMETWARREHYQYYTEKLKVECNMTALIDVKNLLDFCHSCGYKFYASLIYLVTKVVNRIENFRMFRDADGTFVSGSRWFQTTRFFMRTIKRSPIAGRIIPVILIPFTGIS